MGMLVFLALGLADCKKDDGPFIPQNEGPYDRVKVQYKIIDSTKPNSQVSLTLQKVKIEFVDFNFYSTTYDKGATVAPASVLLNENLTAVFDNTTRKTYAYETDCDEDGYGCSTNVVEYSWAYPDLIVRDWTQSNVTKQNFNSRSDLYVAGVQYKYFIGNPSSVTYTNVASSGYDPKLCHKTYNGNCGSMSYSNVTYDRDVTVVLTFDLKDFLD